MILIEKDYLPASEWSRPGKRLVSVSLIVMHWTANPKLDAKETRDYFARISGAYASAHFVVGQAGEIVQCIPTDEVAYHCGSAEKDPKSGKVYTDFARERLGEYASDWKRLSPNLVTLGVEMCPIDEEGDFTLKTTGAAIELAANLCRQFGLKADAVCSHQDIVGWKECPKLWAKEPERADIFRAAVAGILKGNAV